MTTSTKRKPQATNVRPAERLPQATAISAGVKLDFAGDGHPVVLDVMFTDRNGRAHVLPVRLTPELASAISVQLGRCSRNANLTPAPRQRS